MLSFPWFFWITVALNLDESCRVHCSRYLVDVDSGRLVSVLLFRLKVTSICNKLGCTRALQERSRRRRARAASADTCSPSTAPHHPLWSLPRIRRLRATRPQFFIIRAWWQIKSGRRMVDTMLSSWLSFRNSLLTSFGMCALPFCLHLPNCTTSKESMADRLFSFPVLLSASVFFVDLADAEWNWLLLLLVEVVARMTKIYPFVPVWVLLRNDSCDAASPSLTQSLNDINLEEVTTSPSM